jgi:two-component system, NarL family, nitrate/nitrite response regulator NarL
MSSRSVGSSSDLEVIIEPHKIDLARDTRLRLLIVSDVRLYREALALRLGQRERIVVAGAVECRNADREIERHGPDLVLLDAGDWSGLDLARTLLAHRPELSIVAVAVPEIAGHAIAAMWRGIAGFVPRNGSIEDVVAVIDGVTLCDRAPQVAVVREVSPADGVEHAARPSGASELTPREEEIVEMIEIGLSNKQIARNLRIEVGTVKNHVHNILEKLNVRGRSEAAHRMRTHRSAAMARTR